MICDSFKVNVLLVSPDKKWIVAGTKENDDLSPKVFCLFFVCAFPAPIHSCVFSVTTFPAVQITPSDVPAAESISRYACHLVCCQVIYSESLTSPLEDEDPLSRSVPVSGCQAAVFIPTQPARLAVIHHTGHRGNKALTVCDVSLKKTKYKTEIQGEG